MSTGTAVARVPTKRRAFRIALLVALLPLMLILVVVAAISSVPSSSGSFAPSPVAIADIPGNYLVLYQQSAHRFGIDWSVLAAIGKIECDHGRAQAAGCNPPGTTNAAGATGPM